MATKREKVYAVEFIRYTNSSSSTVSDWDGKSDSLSSTMQYLEVLPGPFLVRESDLSYYQRFGGGYKSIHLVGYIDVVSVSNNS